MGIDAVRLLKFSAQNGYICKVVFLFCFVLFFQSEQIIRLAQIQVMGKPTIPFRETENNLWTLVETLEL